LPLLLTLEGLLCLTVARTVDAAAVLARRLPAVSSGAAGYVTPCFADVRVFAHGVKNRWWFWCAASLEVAITAGRTRPLTVDPVVTLSAGELAESCGLGLRNRRECAVVRALGEVAPAVVASCMVCVAAKVLLSCP
jgi:hypothetical protein